VRRRLGILLILPSLLVACGGGDAGLAVRDGSGRVVTAGAWSVFDLRPGDCVGADDSPGGAVDELPLVPCDEPHAQEVFAVVTHPDDAYPGAGAVAAFADRVCLTSLETDLGLSVDDGVPVSYLLPAPEGWDKGDRDVVCVLVLAEDQDVVLDDRM